MSENEQLRSLLARRRRLRILEDERPHRERLAGNSDRATLMKEEPNDEEVAILVDSIGKEVAVIDALCDTLHDRLESVRKSVSASASDVRVRRRLR